MISNIAVYHQDARKYGQPAVALQPPDTHLLVVVDMHFTREAPRTFSGPAEAPYPQGGDRYMSNGGYVCNTASASTNGYTEHNRYAVSNRCIADHGWGGQPGFGAGDVLSTDGGSK